MARKFRKVPNSPVGGVCAGFAYLVGWPTWAIRILFLLIAIFTPFALGLLLVCAYVLLGIFLPTWPERPDDFDETTGD